MEFVPCVVETETTVRNQSQKTRVTKREIKEKYNEGNTLVDNTRKNNPVEYSKNDKFHKSPTISEPIPETSQNIMFSSHKVTDIF